MLKIFAKLRVSMLVILALVSGSAANAQSESGFAAYLEQLSAEARQAGVSQNTVDQVFPTLYLSSRVIELDRSQPGGSFDSPIPPFAPYKARHIDARKIQTGKNVYAINASTLVTVEQQYGVPASIILAIFGHETNYGSYTGDFDLANSLATLAYEGRRRELFSSEFIATLKMIDRGVAREDLKGSWAGAFGYPQFLPSVYLRLAKDGDGDGRPNIWSSKPDTFASIANYFVQAGWHRDEPWGIAVNVPSSLDRNAVANLTEPPVCPRVHERHSQWLTIKEWRALGVLPQDGASYDDDMLATLLEPDGQGNTAYLLTGNYRVILEYNCSNFYGLSVGLLADAIRG